MGGNRQDPEYTHPFTLSLSREDSERVMDVMHDVKESEEASVVQFVITPEVVDIGLEQFSDLE
jgi:endoglucanase Acf2